MKKNRILQIRKRHGYSQAQAAAIMHISRKTYGRVERGETAPSSRFLEKFCKAMNVGIDEIIDTPAMPSPRPLRTEEEESILALYRSLDESGRHFIYRELVMESALCGSGPQEQDIYLL